MTPLPSTGETAEPDAAMIDALLLAVQHIGWTRGQTPPRHEAVLVLRDVLRVPDAGAAGDRERPLPQLKTMRADREAWRKQRGEGMTSAIGEYTPEEFWDLLDDVDALANYVSAPINSALDKLRESAAPESTTEG